MGASQKLQNSIQILIILWLVYPIHTNSLYQVIFVELPFCHFPPPNTSTRGKDSNIQLIFHLNILVFETNGKQAYSFPVLSRFCNCLCIAFFSASLILILTHLVCFRCPHLQHFTSPDFVFLSHMSHTSFLVVPFLGFCRSHLSFRQFVLHYNSKQYSRWA